MKYITVIFISAILSFSEDKSPEWEPQKRVTDASLRGLYMVSDEVIWASGSGGTFLKSKDGGATWLVDIIPGATHLDFRDIHAYDSNIALVLSAGHDARIYRTSDGGITWSIVFFDSTSGYFFDGFDFNFVGGGIAFSDPVDEGWPILWTVDSGLKWKLVPMQRIKLEREQGPAFPLLEPLENEAGFAASGTSIVLMENYVWIGTGGAANARVFNTHWTSITWGYRNTPIMSGPGSGIFSLAFSDNKHGVMVGGSYTDSTNKSANCAYTDDGINWHLVKEQQPNGYRSCVATNGDIWITVGRTGSEYSLNNGHNWIPIGKEGYFSCAANVKIAWAVGRSGKMAKMYLDF